MLCFKYFMSFRFHIPVKHFFTPIEIRVTYNMLLLITMAKTIKQFCNARYTVRNSLNLSIILKKTKKKKP